MRALLILGLAALSCAAADGTVEEPGFLGFVQQHFDEARMALLAGVNPFAGNEAESACEACTEKVSKHIAEMAMAKMEAKCRAGKGCRHACHQLKQDPKVLLGVLMVKVRPVELAELYCAGKGLCTKAQVMGGKLGFHKQAMMMYMNADKEDFDEVIEKAKGFVGTLEVGTEHHGDVKAMFAPVWPQDPTCMHSKIEFVMEQAEARMEDKCEALAKMEKKCPLEQKACEFRGENPEVFHGMMLAKVEPWKFAMGYCAAHKEAPHPIRAALDWVKKKTDCHSKCGWDRRCHHECRESHRHAKTAMLSV